MNTRGVIIVGGGVVQISRGVFRVNSEGFYTHKCMLYESYNKEWT